MSNTMNQDFDGESWEMGYEAGIRGDGMPEGSHDRDTMERGYAAGEAIYVQLV